MCHAREHKYAADRTKSTLGAYRAPVVCPSTIVAREARAFRGRQMQEKYPRDMVGYGRTPPFADWPGGARVALQFVINYEEGGENNILHGDAASEAFLSEIVGAAAWPGQRHMNMESIYEYGSPAGFLRLHPMFTQRSIPLTLSPLAAAVAPT